MVTPAAARLRPLAQHALKRAATAADRLRPPPPGIVVLIYHRVGGGSGLELDLSIGEFRAQMAWLADAGVVMTLDEALRTLDEDRAPRPSRVVVTFDDGTCDFVDHAVPILAEHGIPATLYLATAFVERGEELPYGAPPVSWSGLRDALTSGVVTLGSHTHRHLLLDRLSLEELDTELDLPTRLMERELGTVPRHFAYPKAVLGSPAAEAAVRARFRSAALAGTRPNRFGATDPYRLARSPIQSSDGMRWFAAKVAGGMRLEDDVRRAANRLRYRNART
jgi:peptidoglycan/xylan/chitin deacetylase (PgdA/CDA1 family)